MHSLVGSTEEMQFLVEMGLHISVNEFSFQDVSALEMVKNIPLNKLLLETDAPWGYISPNSDLAKKCRSPVLMPASKKSDKFEKGVMVKERNESCSMPQVAAIVANLRGVSYEEVKSAHHLLLVVSEMLRRTPEIIATSLAYHWVLTDM